MNALYNSPLTYILATIVCLGCACYQWRAEKNRKALKAAFVLAAIFNAYVAGVATP